MLPGQKETSWEKPLIHVSFFRWVLIQKPNGYVAKQAVSAYLFLSIENLKKILNASYIFF